MVAYTALQPPAVHAGVEQLAYCALRLHPTLPA